MNLIELMKHQLIFDALAEKLAQVDTISAFRRTFFKYSPVDISYTRKIVREISLGSLKITNIKVTSKKENQHIITFTSNKDRYKCIWDFVEGKFLLRSVNY